jgi:hypothetical protein
MRDSSVEGVVVSSVREHETKEGIVGSHERRPTARFTARVLQMPIHFVTATAAIKVLDTQAPAPERCGC